MSIMMRKEEVDLVRTLALNVAKEYCLKNTLSLDKLEKQQFDLIYDSAFFGQPTGVIPNGLCNDLATQPLPTLIIKKDDTGTLVVEETEHTRKYLAQ
jgi:hypothetical protein